MKSSLGKLKKFALHKNDPKDKKDLQILSHSDGLAQASQDMKDMRNCYDSLLSAAAAAANSAYEFSESLMEMGNCLLEKIALHGDLESRRAFSVLGRAQLELQKLVDGYRSHIILTITNPSESLLSELRKVEEMKLQCDEKREVYEYLITRGKSGKGENFTSQKLQAAREEYDEMARLCIFRVESLKQGQCRSLLTQAARHHAAQLNFFQKGLKFLEAVDPQVKMVADKQHIDYQVSGLDDADDNARKRYDANDEGELSFDYRKHKQDLNDACSLRNSTELDHAAPSTQTSGMEDIEINIGKNPDHIFSRQPRVTSHSAPIFPEKMDITDRIKEAQASAQKFHTYVLPTPTDAKSLTARISGSFLHSSVTNLTASTNTLWHSSPLDTDDYGKFNSNLSIRGVSSKAQSIFKDSNSNNLSMPLPPPSIEGTSLPQCETQNAFDVKKTKRHSFSGPLASKPSSSKPLLSASGPIGSAEKMQPESGSIYGGPMVQPPSTIDVSHSASPPLISSPKISELHELPRPPGSLASKPGTTALIGHSVPLVDRNQEVSPSNRSPLQVSNSGSALPPPPLTVPRSFSIPSSNQRAMALHVSKLLESPQMKDNAEIVSSPPLSPLSLSNLSTLSGVASSSGQIRGGR
ncbi:PREDICTED: uncharacterized protein At2g33490-like isoform X2 [Ipomoea nil]|uniref:uncharacterized protein At2g33490-like isoform X2 n=1 Tax=Ipomoea nil TaxID=35883 RepID=UPI000901E84B|nr:PREDICTED: uncharacterized protein At2g33490-like isoform X2 [Ipomoea nil]